MRKSGVLMHITSLPSPHGIGTMGAEARKFIDFLEEAGQSCWQVLPLGPTSYGDSPYQSCSTYAGNPYLIDLETLQEEGYLEAEEIAAADWKQDPEKVDFATLYKKRYPLLRIAFERFRQHLPEDYDAFCWEQGEWLEEYALFMAIKTEREGKAWDTWEDSLRLRDPEAIAAAKKELGMEMFFWKSLQYLFFKQWNALKEYAHSKGIQIIGDIPIYVAMDSADVWSAPWYFSLDEDRRPLEVAGCPPDVFSEDGQLWGNPVYRWDILAHDGYDWWKRRLRHSLQIYDVLRIDHFRGFDSYFCIPFGDKTARYGYWRKGPGMHFFRAMEESLGVMPLIAEDLGFLTPSVQKLLRDSGYPGMKVLQFAFGGDETNCYLPHHHVTKSVIYTGTHDNQTNNGWWENISRKERQDAREWLHAPRTEKPNHMMMRAAMESVCETCILTMQDLLDLGAEARMNEPSTLGKNWMWRALPGFTEGLAAGLKELTKRYDRLPKAEEELKPEGEEIPLCGLLHGMPEREKEEEPEEKPEEETPENPA